MAGKPYLSREQFLSLSRLKKEISESEASIWVYKSSKTRCMAGFAYVRRVWYNFYV